MMLLWVAMGCTGSLPPKASPDGSDSGDSGRSDSTPTDDSADSEDSSTPEGESGWIVVSAPRAEDAGGDGVWTAGESLTVYATLTNLRSEDYSYYPGILVIPDDNRVTVPDPGGNWLYALFGNSSSELGVSVVAGEDITTGTTIHFRIEVTSLSCTSDGTYCLDPAPISLDVDVE
jgi:hypothetical protein